jgi:hypothetical protein
MRLMRLSLLLLVVLSALAAPRAFGGGSQGTLGSSGTKSQERLCDEFWIYCNDGSTDTCCADVGSCLNYCSKVCGGPCIYVE